MIKKRFRFGDIKIGICFYALPGVRLGLPSSDLNMNIDFIPFQDGVHRLVIHPLVYARRTPETELLAIPLNCLAHILRP
jgi:hypothetical protein